MTELFASGRIVEAILVLVVLEAVGLIALRRFRGLGPPLAPTLINLLSGAALLLALRAALVGSGWVWVALWLLAGLAAHLGDLALRWQRRRPTP
ncbi:MAG: hypothetical protein GVY28_00495 [Alphaproteobacteria bacterium]|jgi:hypothetical protein|nr:hypothetical protein [Alphaproteobacteria bacterium]